MSWGRLRAFAQDWIAPSLIGLVGAGAVIVAAETGGLVGWLLIGLVALALIGAVAWVVRSAYRDYPFDWPDDEPPPNA